MSVFTRKIVHITRNVHLCVRLCVCACVCESASVQVHARVYSESVNPQKPKWKTNLSKRERKSTSGHSENVASCSHLVDQGLGTPETC